MMRSAPMLRASEVRALRGLIKAAPAVWPYARGESPIERVTREAEDQMRVGVALLMDIEIARQAAERAALASQRDKELAAAGSPIGDRAGAEQGQAPEGTRGAAAAVELVPANACLPAHPVNHGNEFDELIEDAEDFAARVAEASAHRARILARPEPIDWSRVAEAHERKAADSRSGAGRPVAASVPLEPALSPEECRRCGIPGRKGCAHQLPYVAVAPAVSPYTASKVLSDGRQGARDGGRHSVHG